MTLGLRAGVVGAGVFGGYHAGKWAGFEGVTLTAIHDPDSERAASLAARYSATAIDDRMRFLEAVDVVSIASPAHTHADWALAALRAGKSVYVEKPLATDLGKADDIVREAARQGLVVACGFLERAAFRAMRLFDIPETPLFMEAVRFGQRSDRNLDVSVVLDLMIHDLDLALALTPGAPFAVEAEGQALINDQTDRSDAEVSFDDGFTARFLASRVAETPRREMRLVYPSGEVHIDFLAGEFVNTTPFDLDPDFAATAEGRDRLGASLWAFLRAVRGDVQRPIATGEDGVRALDLAFAVQHAIDG